MNSMGKYTVIQHKQHLHWLKDCPVLLQSYALTKDNTDNSILLQCKFENIADKPIKAMNIAVRCSDISYQKLEKVDSFSYLDINIQPYRYRRYHACILAEQYDQKRSYYSVKSHFQR